MEPTHSESLEASLLSLGRLDESHLELGKQMFEAFGGAMYGMDLLAAGALNRSKAHMAGFRTLLEAKNLICAGAILRLQLDTAMRFYAAFLVDQPHDFALAVLRGQRVRDLKDRDGKKMTDAYLVQKLGEEYAWVPRVYERTSGYVHLSSTHLLSALGTSGETAEERRLTIKISAEDKKLPDEIYIEAADAFHEMLLECVGEKEQPLLQSNRAGVGDALDEKMSGIFDRRPCRLTRHCSGGSRSLPSVGRVTAAERRGR